MWNPFSAKKKKEFVNEHRAHAVVDVNEDTFKLMSTKVVGKFEDHEVAPAVEALLRKLDDASGRYRNTHLEEFVEATQKKLGMVDKLARRSKKWSEQAREKVTYERFTGGAGSAVEVTIDGMFTLTDVATKPGTSAVEAFQQAKVSLEAAWARAEARWTECLGGALDSDPANEEASQ